MKMHTCRLLQEESSCFFFLWSSSTMMHVSPANSACCDRSLHTQWYTRRYTLGDVPWHIPSLNLRLNLDATRCVAHMEVAVWYSRGDSIRPGQETHRVCIQLNSMWLEIKKEIRSWRFFSVFYTARGLRRHFIEINRQYEDVSVRPCLYSVSRFALFRRCLRRCCGVFAKT